MQNGAHSRGSTQDMHSPYEAHRPYSQSSYPRQADNQGYGHGYPSYSSKNYNSGMYNGNQRRGQGYTASGRNPYNGTYNGSQNHGEGYTASSSNSYGGIYENGERHNGNENHGQVYTTSAKNSCGGTHGSNNNAQGYTESASISYGERYNSNYNHGQSYGSYSHHQFQSSVPTDGCYSYRGQKGIQQQDGRLNSHLHQDRMMQVGNQSQQPVRNSQSHALPRHGDYQQEHPAAAISVSNAATV